jgi:hypothetical protein
MNADHSNLAISLMLNNIMGEISLSCVHASLHKTSILIIIILHIIISKLHMISRYILSTRLFTRRMIPPQFGEPNYYYNEDRAQ